MSRFVGFAYPDGLYILDTVTGQVTKVPTSGEEPEVIQPPQADWTASHLAVEGGPIPPGVQGFPINGDIASQLPTALPQPVQSPESLAPTSRPHGAEPSQSAGFTAVPSQVVERPTGESRQYPLRDLGRPPEQARRAGREPSPPTTPSQPTSGGYRIAPPSVEPEPPPPRRDTYPGVSREDVGLQDERESELLEPSTKVADFDDAWSDLSYDASPAAPDERSDDDDLTADEFRPRRRTQPLPAVQQPGDLERSDDFQNPFERSDQQITGRTAAPWRDPTVAPRLGPPPETLADRGDDAVTASVPAVPDHLFEDEAGDLIRRDEATTAPHEAQSDALEVPDQDIERESVTDTLTGRPRYRGSRKDSGFLRSVSDTQPGLPSQRREPTPPRMVFDASMLVPIEDEQSELLEESVDRDLWQPTEPQVAVPEEGDDRQVVDEDRQVADEDRHVVDEDRQVADEDRQVVVEDRQVADEDRQAIADRDILTDFPYPIAVSYLGFISEQDPQQQCRWLADTFLSVLRTWALMVAGQYLTTPSVLDSAIDNLLRRDLRRPTAGTFNQLLSLGIPALEGADQSLFCPELARAYAELETECDDRVVLQVRYEEPSGRVRFNSVELGKIQALIRYYDSLTHGLPETPERARSQLEVYTPLLRDVLGAAQFMTAYPLYCAEFESTAEIESAAALDTADLMRVPREDDEPFFYRLAGAVPSSDPEHLADADFRDEIPPLFVLSETTGAVLPLTTLIELATPASAAHAIPGLGRNVYLFDGYYGGGLLYISSAGERIERFDRLSQWLSLAGSTATDVEFEVVDPPSYEALVEIAGGVTRGTIATLVSSGVYIRETTFERPTVNEKLLQLDLGDFRGMILSGESGIGKTTLMAQLAEVRLERGDAVLFYESGCLRDTRLAERISSDLGLGELTADHLLETLATCFASSPQNALDTLAPEATPRLFVLIDGVTEFAGEGDTRQLVREIDELVAASAPFEWFRLVSSVRSGSYKQLPKKAHFGRVDGTRYLTVDEMVGEAMTKSSLVTLAPLSSRDLNTVYDLYRDFRRPPIEAPESPGVYVFRPTSEFVDLDIAGSTGALIRKPLLMRLALAAYHGEQLPSTLTYDDLFGHVFERLVERRDTEGGDFVDRITFLGILVQELDTLSSPVVPRDHLYGVVGLREAMVNARPDSPYQQLLEMGVLREDWIEGECRVRFTVERIFEFLLAEHYRTRVEALPNVHNLIRQAVEFESLQGALDLILLRAVTDGNHDLLTHAFAAAASDDAGWETAESTILFSAVLNVMEHLAWGQPDVFAELLPVVFANSAATEVDCLIELAQRLREQRANDATDLTIDHAVSLAEQLADAPRLVSVLVLRSQRNAETGQIDDSLADLEAARLLALEAGDSLRALHIEAERGHLLRLQYHEDEAFEILADVARKLYEIGDVTSAIRCRLEQAEILNSRGDLEAEIGMTEIALEWAHNVGDLSLETQTLGRLAWLYLRGYDIEQALESQSQALAVASLEGDYRTIASMLNLKGLVSWDQNFDEAASALVDSRNLALRTGDRRAVMVASSNLADLRLLQGHLEEAEILTRQSIAMARESKADDSEGWNLGKLAKVALEAGTLSQAQSLAEEALDRNEEIGNRRGQAFCLGYLAEVGLERGEMDVSRELAQRAVGILEELDETSELTWLWNLLGQSFVRVGRLDQAEMHFKRIAVVGDKAAIPFAIATGAVGLAEVAQLKGDWQNAQTRLDAAIDWLTHAGSPSAISRAKQLLCKIHLDQASYDSALVLAEESFDVSQTLANPRLWAQAHHTMALALKENGQVTEAVRRARQALEIRKILDHPIELAETWAVLGVCHNLNDKLEEAADCFDAGLKLASSTGYAPIVALALWLSASLAIDCGTDEPVVEWAERLDRISRSISLPVIKAINAALKVRIAARTGDEFKLHNSLLDVEAAYAAVPGTPPLELSPTSAYLDSAVFYLSLGRTRRCRELADLSRGTAGDRPYPRLSELQQLPKGDHTDFEPVPS